MNGCTAHVTSVIIRRRYQKYEILVHHLFVISLNTPLLFTVLASLLIISRRSLKMDHALHYWFRLKMKYLLTLLLNNKKHKKTMNQRIW